MRPPYLSCILLLTVLAAASAIHSAFAGATTEPATQPWGETNDGLRARVTANPSVHKAGDPIVCNVELENVGDKDVIIGVRSAGVSDFEFEVIFQGVGEVPLTKWGLAEQLALGRVQSKRIKPGEVYAEKLLVSRAYDMSLDGTYRIAVHRAISIPGDPSKAIHLESNELSLVVE
jgi:hypothetical protein